MRFSAREKTDLLKAWAAISIAFAILLSGATTFIQAAIISAITVGAGFLLHELAHKLVAQHYHYWAEFRADDRMLIFAIISAFLGFIFAAPGAVMIHGHVTLKRSGIIAAAGPVTNIVLVAAFYAISPFLPAVGSYGAMINSWLALFNMIPFMGLDGAKVLRWSKPAYFAIVILAFLSFVLL